MAEGGLAFQKGAMVVVTPAMAASACCCCSGLGAMLYRRHRQGVLQKQRYEALATADEDAEEAEGEEDEVRMR